MTCLRNCYVDLCVIICYNQTTSLLFTVLEYHCASETLTLHIIQSYRWWLKCSCVSAWWPKLTSLLSLIFSNEKSCNCTPCIHCKARLQPSTFPALEPDLITRVSPWHFRNALVNSSCHQNQVIPPLLIWATSAQDYDLLLNSLQVQPEFTPPFFFFFLLSSSLWPAEPSHSLHQ